VIVDLKKNITSQGWIQGGCTRRAPP